MKQRLAGDVAHLRELDLMKRGPAAEKARDVVELRFDVDPGPLVPGFSIPREMIHRLRSSSVRDIVLGGSVCPPDVALAAERLMSLFGDDPAVLAVGTAYLLAVPLTLLLVGGLLWLAFRSASAVGIPLAVGALGSAASLSALSSHRAARSRRIGRLSFFGAGKMGTSPTLGFCRRYASIA